MPSFTTRVPLLLTAAAGGLLTAWVLTPQGPPKEARPPIPDSGIPQKAAPHSAGGWAPMLQPDVSPDRTPETAGRELPPDWITRRDENGRPRPATAPVPPPPPPGVLARGHTRALRAKTAPTSSESPDRFNAPAGLPRHHPRSTEALSPAGLDDTWTNTEPLVVPYSPLDPSIAATLPAVLAAMPAAAGVDEAQAEETTRLTEDFFRRIRGASEDPQDTAYQQRWLKAQEESDARMRASLGGQAWLDHHREAHRQAQEPAVDVAAPTAAGG